MFLLFFFFFFSSRRRHTRLQGDWSSDVCSSTRRLGGGARPEPTVAGAVGIGFAQAVAAGFRGGSRSRPPGCAAPWGGLAPAPGAAVRLPLPGPPGAGAAVPRGRHAAAAAGA